MPKRLRTSSRCTTSTSGKGSVKYVNWSPWCITLSSSVPLWNASNVSVSPSPFLWLSVTSSIRSFAVRLPSRIPRCVASLPFRAITKSRLSTSIPSPPPYRKVTVSVSPVASSRVWKESSSVSWETAACRFVFRESWQ